MADTMEILFGLGGGPPSAQWWTAKLILFLNTYLFSVPTYFDFFLTFPHECIQNFVIKYFS